MNSKTVAYVFLAFIAILGWNAFLIKRDKELFDAHDRQAAIQRLQQPPSSQILTPKEKFCQQQANWHPDCNLE